MRDCKKYGHVPVAGVDRHNRVLNLECQECGAPVTRQEYDNFWPGNRINWNEAGDPNDLTPMCDSDGYETRVALMSPPHNA